MGVKCYGNNDICEQHKDCLLLPDLLRVNGFTIQHFSLVHNVSNDALVIDTDDGIRILYCTDTRYIPKKVKGVHYAIIECNYNMDDIIEDEINNIFTRSQFMNHQSIDNCIKYLKAIYNVDLQGIILWHLSSSNIDPNKAQERVRKELGFNNVYIAKKGLGLDLVNSEF